jgi:two-component system, OmpR family, sensor histidine kinase BaeS
MFRTIPRRMIFSQLLVLLIVMPLMGILLIFGLESRFLLPKLANTLLGDARLLSEISSAEYELWGNPILFENLISRVQLDSSIKVMFLDPTGRPLYSTDPADYANSITVNPNGILSAQKGREIALTSYSIIRVKDTLVDVYEPVIDSSNSVTGIVRLTYRVESLYQIFDELRWQIILIVLLGLVISALISAGLAIRISRPITKVTKAIYDLAVGRSHVPLEEKGPEELQSQAQAVNFLVDELNTNEKSRRQLLANLVHELGRPLGSIRSAIHALETGADKDPVLYKDLTLGMDAETLRLQHLLDDLSHLYDQSVGALELNILPVDVNKWLPGVLRSWQILAQDKGLIWTESITPLSSVIKMDADRIAQVVGNLLSNAVKYTKSGGSVSVTAGIENNQFHIAIQDTGVGIQPDEIKKVFQPFYRGEQGRRIKQGMGLGFSIAKDLTEAHGGTLEVSSQPGGGSTFEVWLPLNPETPKEN